MRKALLHYLQGVKARIPQLVWLLIAMLAILTLNNLVMGHPLDGYVTLPYPHSDTPSHHT